MLLVRKLLPLLSALALLLPTGVATWAHPGQGEYRPNELVCEMVPGYDIEIINTEYGTTVKGHQEQTDCYLLSVPSDLDAESLAVVIDARPEVLYCGLNYYLDAPEGLQRSQPFLDYDGSGEYDAQTAALTLDLPAVRELSTGSGVRIALLDGGANFAHPLFADGSVISVYDYIDQDDLAFDEPGGVCSGHGTFIAGILKLVAPDAEIHVYRVLDTVGRGTGYDIASALLHAVDNGCRVANLSLGMIGSDPALEEALRYARDRKLLVVAAAGNDSTSDDMVFPFPASRANCVAVTAVDSLNVKADFANYGPKVAYCAPGIMVYGPYLDSAYAWWNGTSFAAPFVSGTAALIAALDSALLRNDVDTLLALSAISVDAYNPGLEGQLGHGLVDPGEALALARSALSGDLDLDGSVQIDDALSLISWTFKGGDPPPVQAAGDTNCDGVQTAADIVRLVRYIFLAGEGSCKVQ